MKEQHLHLRIFNAKIENIENNEDNKLSKISIQKLDGSAHQVYNNARLLEIDDQSVYLELIVQRV